MSAVDGLDGPCPACERVAGDHTLREWAACLGLASTAMPYEEVPEDAATVANASLRERFQLDPDVIVADHVIVRAATLNGHTGSVAVRLPVVLHEFQVGVPGRAPVEVAKVAYVAGTAKTIRDYGRLVRDSANGAANRAEGK